MLRRLIVVAALLSTVPAVGIGQTLTVLHIRVVLMDADRKATPVPRHALLISDNPATSTPRRIVTGMDGTADVRLRPGNYTVESDRPVAFAGKAYQWVQTLDIVAGRDAVLELTAANAEIGAIDSANTPAAVETDTWTLLNQWQDSVVALWTPTTHASGFLIDANGLVATSQRSLGGATTVEVQITPTVKVAATILVADQSRDVAVLWIDPAVMASVRAVPLACAQLPRPAVVDGQEIFAIEAPLQRQKGTTSGTASRVAEHSFASDLALGFGSAGGPVFSADGRLIGITTVAEQGVTAQRRGNSRVVRLGAVCDVVASAEQKKKDGAPASGTHLPVEPSKPFPVDALKETVQGRAGSVSPYPMSSSDFDLAFITPVLIYGEQYQAEQMSRRDRGRGARPNVAPPIAVRTTVDFGNWSPYLSDFPPVLLIRVTPKMVEGFWTKVARGAAQTQGMALPPMKHVKSGFSRLRAFCGDSEVTPIHPFKIEQRVSESDAIYEGLYVFDPDALTPSCGTVKLVLYSEKEPEKGDTQVVDAKVIQQVWQDFAAYRALK